VEDTETAENLARADLAMAEIEGVQDNGTKATRLFSSVRSTRK